ncbi:MAG: transcriptional regulator [Desulfobacterales bacterium CG2_30_60_27]|nr:MAG: transcriptional regulator [Desulfobacterales bacterium CG2_30_60_27]
MSRSLVEMAADIVQSQSASKAMTADEVASALQSTYRALQALQGEEARCAAGEAGGAGAGVGISAAKSIQKNKIVCMECGQEFRMLSPKHLKSHELTGRTYREKHGFSLRQPLCAKSLSERRKKAGKERGLPDNLRLSIANRKKTAATPKNNKGKKKAAKK